MSYQPMHDLAEFHKFFEVTEKDIDLRKKLIAEECSETLDALTVYRDIPSQKYKAELAKELADLLYVVYGTAEILDIPLQEVFQAVHQSNMSKLVDGEPLRRADGKILKGPYYEPPDIESLLEKDAN